MNTEFTKREIKRFENITKHRKLLNISLISGSIFLVVCAILHFRLAMKIAALQNMPLKEMFALIWNNPIMDKVYTGYEMYIVSEIVSAIFLAGCGIFLVSGLSDANLLIKCWNKLSSKESNPPQSKGAA